MGSIKKRYKDIPVQVRASFWFLICGFLQNGISVLTTPIFTRLLTTAEYGQYNVFNSWSGIISIFVGLGLSGGVYVQGLVKFEDRNVFASSIQGLSIVVTSLWTVIYLVFRTFWNQLFNLTTVQMLAMLVMIWASNAFSLWSGDQRVDYKYKALVVLTIFVSIAKPVVGIILVLNAEDKVTARILGLALVEVFAYSWLSIIELRKGKKIFSKKYWKYAIVFSLPLVPHYLSQCVFSSSDRIMISNMVGDGEAGIYSLAYSLSRIMIIFNNALTQTLDPWIYKKIKGKQIEDISSVAYISLIAIAFVNLCLILIAPEAVAVFAPESYYDAIWVIPPVAMSVYFIFSYDLFSAFAFYFEKTKLIMASSILVATLNVVLNYIFIKLYGYVAAGYTTLVCYVAYSIEHYILMNRICKKYCDGVRPYNTKIILLISILFVSLGFALLFTYRYAVIRYVLVALICIGMILKRKDLISIGKKVIGLKNQ